MTLVPLVRKVRIVKDQLFGRKHSFVDDHVGRKRTDVKHHPLRQGGIGPQSVAGLLAYEIQLPFKRIIRKPVCSSNHQLFDRRFRLTRRRPDIRFFCFRRNSPPAKCCLPLLVNDFLDQLLTRRALSLERRKKNIAD